MSVFFKLKISPVFNNTSNEYPYFFYGVSVNKAVENVNSN
jgi:hypothetical protein